MKSNRVEALILLSVARVRGNGHIGAPNDLQRQGTVNKIQTRFRGGIKKLSLVSKFIQNRLFGDRRKEEAMTSPAGKQLINILAKH